ncbi:hypothetical protein Gogos_010287 [Gossypium gossypioides]|uniref:RNase H type-1 domain-containing protein n=1 Tax=Gossypium gossypioides TaxID=34282 RepID=A0A7J9BKV2_GOSGO|nr:hypothetical protein [Gossypium gossypioides]
MHDNISMKFAAEGMTCLQAMQLRLDLQLLVIEIKGDAHLVVRKMQKEEDISEIGPYIGDSKRLCASYRSNFSRYTSRQSNGVAHILAQSWVEVMNVAEGSLNISGGRGKANNKLELGIVTVLHSSLSFHIGDFMRDHLKSPRNFLFHRLCISLFGTFVVRSTMRSERGGRVVRVRTMRSKREGNGGGGWTQRQN